MADASPELIRDMIERHGANAVVSALWRGDNDQGWSQVEERIASGEQAWLDLVPLLDPGADGGASLGMSIAVSEALPRNPAGVLRLMSDRDTPDRVCGMNRLEPTDQEVAAYYAAAIPAVETVTAPELADLKAQCLAALRQSQAEHAEYIDP